MIHLNPIKNESGETVKSGCIVVNNDGQVLLVGDLKGEKWSFPKGHAESGETSEQVAIREVKEETGIDVEIIKRLSDITYTHGDTGELIRISMFLANPLNLKIVAENGIRANFFNIDKAKEIVYSNISFILDEIS